MKKALLHDASHYNIKFSFSSFHRNNKKNRVKDFFVFFFANFLLNWNFVKQIQTREDKSIQIRFSSEVKDG